jgi:hypothetical protein
LLLGRVGGVTDFATSTDRLLNQVRHWEQPRWSRHGDQTFALVQLLADLTADTAGLPHRPVPREHDMVLPDQIRVMVDDLLAADPSDEVLATATEAVDALRATL